MKTVIAPKLLEAGKAAYYFPAVTIILPFEPKMSLKSPLIHSLTNAANKIEHELSGSYPDDLGMLVMHRLGVILRNLNYDTYKKSIAIYVSPVFEKILYLGFEVEEKVTVTETFSLRDIIQLKKQSHQYLVLLLSSKASLVFAGNSSGLVRLVSNTADSFDDHSMGDEEGLVPLGPSTLEGDAGRNKFLHHIDNVLDIILRAYNLPLFVLASPIISAQFQNITKHSPAVIEYIQGNYDEIALCRLKEILLPKITDWQKVMQVYFLNKLEDARANNNLVTGIQEVWCEAMNNKGRLLVMERNFSHTMHCRSSEELINRAMEPYNQFSCIKDAVDEIVEKLLENGADVEFVEDGVLKNYEHIALVT